MTERPGENRGKRKGNKKTEKNGVLPVLEAGGNNCYRAIIYRQYVSRFRNQPREIRGKSRREKEEGGGKEFPKHLNRGWTVLGTKPFADKRRTLSGNAWDLGNISGRKKKGRGGKRG